MTFLGWKSRNERTGLCLLEQKGAAWNEPIVIFYCSYINFVWVSENLPDNRKTKCSSIDVKTANLSSCILKRSSAETVLFDSWPRFWGQSHYWMLAAVKCLASLSNLETGRSAQHCRNIDVLLYCYCYTSTHLYVTPESRLIAHFKSTR